MYTPPSAKPIGVVFPLQKGSNGYFNQSFDTLSQSRASLINFLNTRRGERVMNPTFGSQIYNYIFETEIDESLIDQIIKEEISYWIPTIIINSVKVNISNGDADNGIIYLKINYSIVNTNLNSSLIIGINYNASI